MNLKNYLLWFEGKPKPDATLTSTARYYFCICLRKLAVPYVSLFLLPLQMESSGTVLSTNWRDVGKRKVEVKPPGDVEYKKY